MSTKKQRKGKELEARKKKRRKRYFFLTLLLTVSIGFLIFFFVSLFDFLYPPVTKEGHEARQREKQKVQLYFADGNERFLVAETRFLPKRDKAEDRATEIVRALVDGPKLGSSRTLPAGSTLRGVRIDRGGTAVVDFGRDLVDRHPGGSTSELMTVYSLAASLVENVSEIKSVKILVDGKERETLKGQIDLRHPFSPKKDLLAGGASS